MSLPRYGKYKDSGVSWLGSVPAHWDVLRLKYVCEVFPSNVDKHSRDGEPSVLLCNYTDVYYNEEITSEMQFMAATASPDQVARFSLKAGDTIITKDSETADDIAIAAYVPHDLPGVICGYHLSMIRPREATAGAFVKRLFDSTYAKARFAVAANGLTRVGLGQYALDNVEFPFPPLAEQTAIAAFLDRETAKIDALIAEQERLIALLAEKRQATISHAVTRGLNPDVPMKDSGVAWLGKVPAHWKVLRLKRVVLSIEQGWSPQCENFPVENANEWGVLKVGCVNGGTFNASENKKLPNELEPIREYSLKKGDLLVSRANTRELVGSAAVVLTDFDNLLLCDKLYRLRMVEVECLPEFAAAYLGTRTSRSQIELEATGASSSMLNIGQSAILDLPISLPSLEEQRVIVSLLAIETLKFDSLKVEAERAIALLKERRNALITAAVTGQIDVRAAVAQRTNFEEPATA
ncbi:MAG: restriction endonuclease subunit S [Ralstonia sp.]|uniref:restriction endonuclease subunit S n=1 Tax=Ralstonia sp. TaxID=54061 RepID=UPI003F8031CD